MTPDPRLRDHLPPAEVPPCRARQHSSRSRPYCEASSSRCSTPTDGAVAYLAGNLPCRRRCANHSRVRASKNPRRFKEPDGSRTRATILLTRTVSTPPWRGITKRKRDEHPRQKAVNPRAVCTDQTARRPVVRGDADGSMHMRGPADTSRYRGAAFCTPPYRARVTRLDLRRAGGESDDRRGVSFSAKPKRSAYVRHSSSRIWQTAFSEAWMAEALVVSRQVVEIRRGHPRSSCDRSE
jgi:hypothetical protein